MLGFRDIHFLSGSPSSRGWCELKITRFAQSCIAIEQQDKHAYIDPYKMQEGAARADAILITHPHPDHLDRKSISRLLMPGTAVVHPIGIKQVIKGIATLGLMPDESCEVAGMSVRGIHAYNMAKFFHPRKKGWLGYIITTGDKVLYHAGDTDAIPEMSAIGHVDVAFLPIGGLFTMDIDGAVEAIKTIKPTIVVPVHELRRDGAELAALVKEEVPGVVVHVLRAGESMSV